MNLRYRVRWQKALPSELFRLIGPPAPALLERMHWFAWRVATVERFTRRRHPYPAPTARLEVGHRTRNSVAAVSTDDGPFCTDLFSWKILAWPSITSRVVSSAATELGSKMVARRSVFVR
jgi:hypothetical protein